MVMLLLIMENQNTDKTEASIIIDAFGGTKAMADIVGITPGAVSQWRYKGIPPITLRYLKLLFKVKFKELQKTVL